MGIRPFTLERYFDAHEAKTSYHLSASDCESHSLRDLLALQPGAAEAFERQGLGYTESEGGVHLREAIADLYECVRAEDVLVHTGAGEAIHTFMNGVLRPGDHVIVHYPCFQPLFEIAEFMGCDVTRLTVRAEDAWRLDLDALEHAITSKTRAIVINCPHNPTGYVMDVDDLNAIVTLARARNIVLFSDEVFRGLEYDPQVRLPLACDLYEHAVSLGGMSKTFGLPGLRIGWLATQNPELKQAILGFKDYTTRCNSGPSEFLARVALSARAAIHERNLRIAQSNLELLREFFGRHAERLRWVEPRAGVLGFPTLTDGDVDTLCHNVLEHTGVLILPGTLFDAGSNEFRLGFGRKNLPKALERLDSYLSAN